MSKSAFFWLSFLIGGPELKVISPAALITFKEKEKEEGSEKRGRGSVANR